MHECPDLFKVQDWWYLVFSEFSDGFAVRYRMARTLAGPWQSAPEDSLDSRAYYAAKTASDGTRRYAFGSIPTKEGETDSGAWQWGGELLVHELCQREDGRLDTRMPEAVRRPFGRRTSLADPVPVVGDWEFQEGKWRGNTPDSYAEATFGPLPDECRIVADLRFDQGTRECGLVIRGSADGSAGYYVRLDPLRGRIVLDQWPRTAPGELQWEIGGDKPYVIETERAVELQTEKAHHLEVLVERDHRRGVPRRDRSHDLPDVRPRLGPARAVRGRGRCHVLRRRRVRQVTITAFVNQPNDTYPRTREEYAMRPLARKTKIAAVALAFAIGAAPSVPASASPRSPAQTIKGAPIVWFNQRPSSGPVDAAVKVVAGQFAKLYPGFKLVIETTANRPAYLQKIYTLAAANQLPQLFDEDATPYAQESPARARSSTLGRGSTKRG